MSAAAATAADRIKGYLGYGGWFQLQAAAHGITHHDVRAVLEQLDAALAVIEAVKALHVATVWGTGKLPEPLCAGCRTAWPCATAKLLEEK